MPRKKHPVTVLRNLEQESRKIYTNSTDPVMQFRDAPPIKFDQECEVDDVYQHFKLMSNNKVPLEYENSNENAKNWLVLLDIGMINFLDLEDAISLSITCKALYCKIDTREIMFPEYEDVPRVPMIAFDVYYIPINSEIHRFTLVRSHGTDSFVKRRQITCFVDGQLVFVHCRMRPVAYNRETYKTQYNARTKTYHFLVSGVKFSIRPDGDFTNLICLYYQLVKAYSPLNFAIYKEGKLLTQSQKERKSIARGNVITGVICGLVLWPFLVVYTFALIFTCFCACQTKCIVRKYMVTKQLTRKKMRKVMKEHKKLRKIEKGKEKSTTSKLTNNGVAPVEPKSSSSSSKLSDHFVVDVDVT